MSKSSKKSHANRANKAGADTAPPKQDDCKPLRKSDRLIAMLDGEAGVTIAQISDELGWLPHTCRAALSGLRKAGHEIETIKAKGELTRYRIHGARAKAAS